MAKTGHGLRVFLFFLALGTASSGGYMLLANLPSEITGRLAVLPAYMDPGDR
jgi:hypothetical protein